MLWKFTHRIQPFVLSPPNKKGLLVGYGMFVAFSVLPGFSNVAFITLYLKCDVRTLLPKLKPHNSV